MNSNRISSLVRANIRQLTPYRSARDEFRGEAGLFLDANENPFPSAYNRYPDARQEKLRIAVSRLKKTTPQETLLTNGSDEAIDLIIRAFCTPKVDSVLIPQPTYGMYATWARINDVRVHEIGLTKSFDLDPESIQKQDVRRVRIIFLCSPNNPTGNLLSAEKVKQLLRSFDGLVVIDEAYQEFSGEGSWVSQLRKYPNLIVLHTFSKAWGLAGLRVGVCLAHPEVIRVLDKIKPPYNVSSAAEKIIRHAITNRKAQVAKQVAVIVRERERLKAALLQLSFVREVYPSSANFLLVRVDDAKLTYRALLKRGVVVRLRTSDLNCDNCLRISVGLPAENKKLIAALKSL